ncbi:MAG: hypothetical protein ACR2FG_13040 [Marmoricola sp.]
MPASFPHGHGPCAAAAPVLVAGRRTYQAVGFVVADEEPHRSFGHDLVGQKWVLDLCG